MRSDDGHECGLTDSDTVVGPADRSVTGVGIVASVAPKYGGRWASGDEEGEVAATTGGHHRRWWWDQNLGRVLCCFIRRRIAIPQAIPMSRPIPGAVR